MNEDLKHNLAAALTRLELEPPCSMKEEVMGIDGAFIVKGLLSLDESEKIREAVRNICQQDPKLHASDEKDTRRRKSQHHTPCKVDESDLTLLADRLLPHLPVSAGPENASTLEEPISNFLRYTPFICYNF